MFRLREAHKHNFDAITTLHVEHEPATMRAAPTSSCEAPVLWTSMRPRRSSFVLATRAVSRPRVRGDPPRGEALRASTSPGVFANEEPNFLFSYNVTSLTTAMKKRLNRERLNVGRTTYAERVKVILRSAQWMRCYEALADQVGARARGEQCDEMQWTEIAHRALNLFHERERVAFVTEQRLHERS